MTATIRVKDGEATQWWNIVAFSESVQAKLMRLSEGDALSVQGTMTAGIHEKDSDTKLSLSIVADHILALRQPQKPPAARCIHGVVERASVIAMLRLAVGATAR